MSWFMYTDEKYLKMNQPKNSSMTYIYKHSWWITSMVTPMVG